MSRQHDDLDVKGKSAEPFTQFFGFAEKGMLLLQDPFQVLVVLLFVSFVFGSIFIGRCDGNVTVFVVFSAVVIICVGLAFFSHLRRLKRISSLEIKEEELKNRLRLLVNKELMRRNLSER